MPYTPDEMRPAINQIADLSGYPPLLVESILLGDLDVPEEGFVLRIRDRKDLCAIADAFQRRFDLIHFGALQIDAAKKICDRLRDRGVQMYKDAFRIVETDPSFRELLNEWKLYQTGLLCRLSDWTRAKHPELVELAERHWSYYLFPKTEA